MTTEVRGWNDAREESGAKECQRPPEPERSEETAPPTESPNAASPADTLTRAQ